MTKKRLRSGYTTGACAAAAAKAAAIFAMKGKAVEAVDLCFPDGSQHSFKIHRSELRPEGALASVIKDAGDDPDVTNGAEICATVSLLDSKVSFQNAVIIDNISLMGGKGIGTVTKPGLAVDVGEPAINPVPRQMICSAVREIESDRPVAVTISVPEGEHLAEKTLNHRLGIIGGLSILGTTGIVRPISAEAWTATIEASMNVAHSAGLQDIVLSTGRTSEKGAQSLLDLPVEAFAMMGDYLEFSLKKAREIGFNTIHLAGMWAKIVKAAMEIPQTHVRNGALETSDAAEMLHGCGVEGDLLRQIEGSNTAREMLTHLQQAGRNDVIVSVCRKAKDYGQKITGKTVKVYLIDSATKVVEHV